MAIATEQKSQYITELLNGTLTSIKQIIPTTFTIGQPELLNHSLQLEFGVLIGITGDVKGKLVISGETSTFGSIGKSMFGMPLEGEMLYSFSGELGNMIAGGLSTNLVEKGIKTDITSPTIMQGNTNISGFTRALQLKINFDNIGPLNIRVLVD